LCRSTRCSSSGSARPMPCTAENDKDYSPALTGLKRITPTNTSS
jgi:hypothetical protein